MDRIAELKRIAKMTGLLLYVTVREIVSTGYVTAVGFGAGWFVSLLLPGDWWAIGGAAVAFTAAIWKGAA